MKKFVRSRIVSIVFLTGLILSVSIFFLQRDTTPEWTTDQVTEGTVKQVISVSGAVDAVGSAELAFPGGGILESITVKEGDLVTEGQTLATLVHNDLKADYQDAYAARMIAEADQQELLTGLRPEERDVQATTVAIAEENLLRITKENDERVTNAYRTLLSSDLEAYPTNNNTRSIPPSISGTYLCDEGTYTINVFRSRAQSGYSYRLEGLETGVYSAFTDVGAPMGSCGLRIQFRAGETYSDSEWEIQIPNIASSLYATNLNAYNLALVQRKNAVHAAEQELVLAKQNQTVDTALPRDEDRTREEARVLQAEARLQVISAQISDHVLKAPFTGTVTNIDPVVGETVGSNPVITMVSDNAYALTALIPEIDITHIEVGQKASVVFDARQSETLSATVTFISPLAKEVDGVSYFEAKLNLDSPVDWLRSGLNADIDIIVEQRDNVTRIPKRYVYESDAQTFVNVPDGESTKAVPVEALFTGNDGFIHISGLNAGDVIIAP